MEDEEWATDRESLERVVEVTFFRAGGPGGQHRNKTESGVRMVHEAAGVTVTATERRSQRRNLELAYERMAERLEKLNERVKPRVATRPTRASRERRLEDKRQRSNRKRNRGRPANDD